jgi:CRP-like cAMP-binding protein
MQMPETDAQTETKHTKGPWRAIQMAEGLWQVIDDPERTAIAVIDYASDNDEATRLSAGTHARLIAAAPDLMEALSNLTARLIHSHESWVEVRAARAALSKASA